MKISWFWALFVVAGTVFTFVNFSGATGDSGFTDLVSTNFGDSTTMAVVSRKLKEEGSSIRSININKGDTDHVTLDDYLPIDPAPSSKASIEPGPIEHGTPLMPFIPKPSPPGPPKHGGST